MQDILGLGPLQMALCTFALSLVLLKGAELTTELAIVLGATLALSSTAVATETVKEYSQQSCPVGLSLTLGAFLSGMIISETPYRHVIQTEVKPFRGLLLGFFFITVGMALTPSLSALGHRLTARLADEAWKEHAGEVTGEQEGPAEVVIIGMSDVGRQLAHALDDHGIAYKVFDFDHDRFVTARIDGYAVAFGDLADLRLAETIQMAEARILAIAVPREQVAAEVGPIISVRYPNLTRFVSTTTGEESRRFEALGAIPILSYSFPDGVDLAGAVLHSMGISGGRIEKWTKRQQDRALEMDPEMQATESGA